MKKNRKKFLIAFFVVLVILIFIIIIMRNNIPSLNSSYEQIISNFIEVNVTQIEEKISNGDQFILFSGRATCPWCRKALPILYTAANQLNIKIYYLDTEDTPYSLKIQKFRKDYLIETVPSILKFYDKKFNKVDFDITNQKMDENELIDILVNELK